MDTVQGQPLELIRRAYFAGHIGDFPNLYERPFEIKSKKLIEKIGGTSSLVVNRCLTKQLPYVTNTNHQNCVYNMRRINQLCLHLNGNGINEGYCEPCFLYDYDFMWSFLHCYKMSDRIMAYSPYSQFRFLLTQYKTCSTILDNYPDNFAFEMSSRLTPIVDILPELTYNLLRQCSSHCFLRILNSNQIGCFDPGVTKYMAGTVHAIIQGYKSVILLLSGKLLRFRWYEQDWTGKVHELELPSNEFVLFRDNGTHMFLGSKSSLLIFGEDCREFFLQLNVENAIHINFLEREKEGYFLCSKGDKSISVWDRLKGTLIKQYWFDEPILNCCSKCRIHTFRIIKVTLETYETHYLYLTHGTYPFCEDPVHFELLGILKEQPGTESFFLNADTDVYYSEGQSHIYLYHLDRPDNDRLEKIVNLPPLNRIVYLQQFSTEYQHDVLIWLTIDSIVIYHSCGNFFTIPGEYHHVCMQYININYQHRPFICCLNRNLSRIDIFEWKINEDVHRYRLIAHIQCHEKISHFTCELGEYRDYSNKHFEV